MGLAGEFWWLEDKGGLEAKEGVMRSSGSAVFVLLVLLLLLLLLLLVVSLSSGTSRLWLDFSERRVRSSEVVD